MANSPHTQLHSTYRTSNLTSLRCSIFISFAQKWYSLLAIIFCFFSISACNSDPGYPKFYPPQTDSPNWAALKLVADSMLNQASTSLLPPEKLIELHLLRAASLVTTGEDDLILQDLLSAKSIASQMGLAYENALTDYELANFFNSRYAQSLALPYAEKAYAFFDDNRDGYAEFGKVAQKMGQIHLFTNNYPKSLFYLEQASNFFENRQDTLLNVSVLMDKGYAQIRMRQTDAAKQTSQTALLLMQQYSNPATFSVEFTNLAINYKYFDQDSSIILLQHAMDLSAPLQDSMNLIISKYNLANALLLTKRYSEANDIYNQVNEYCERNNVAIGYPLVLVGKGNSQLMQEQYREAIQSLTQALEIFDQLGANTFAKDFYPSLYEAYLKDRQPEKAQQIRNKMELTDEQERNQQLSDILELNQKAAAIEQEMLKKQTLQNQKITLQTQHETYQTTFVVLLVFFMLASTITWQRLRLQKSRNIAVQVVLEKYKNSPAPGTKSSLAEALLDLFKESEIYLDPELRVESVIHHLNTDYFTFNDLLKNHFQTNFPSFVNHYRTSYAQVLLFKEAYSDLTMEQIAKKSGFGTRQAFYKAFQKRYGVTPGQMKAAMANILGS